MKVVSGNTDALVLCVAFSSDIPSSIYVKSGTKVATTFGLDNTKALRSLHAMTGCDKVSAFAEKGKVYALKLMKGNPEHREALQRVGEDCNLSQEHFQKLKAFTCHLYSTQEASSVNELHYQIFCAKKGEAESWQLPPCKSTLYQQCQRANYQAGVWKQTLERCPTIPAPTGKGWYTENVVDN